MTTATDQLGEWEEERCMSALAQLEKLQIQVDELRLSVTHIIEPLMDTHENPAGLFSDFKKAAYGASRDLDQFRTAWGSEETRNVLDHIAHSQQLDPDLTEGDQTPHFGWIEAVHTPLPETGRPQTGDAHETAQRASPIDQDLDVLIDTYKQNHPKLEVHLENDSHQIKIKLDTDIPVLRFIVHLNSNGAGTNSIQVECLGSTKLHVAIARCIASRPHPDDLQTALDMIASYENVRTATCTKCLKLLDREGMRPAARRKRGGKQASQEDLGSEWAVCHETCLD